MLRQACAVLALVQCATPSAALTAARRPAALHVASRRFGALGARGGEAVKAPSSAAVGRFVEKQFFVLGMGAAVAAAAVQPAAGVVCGPVVDRFAVGVVFLLSGLGLKVSELAAAALDVRLNAATQGASLVVVPLCAAPACAGMRALGLLDPRLCDGLLATACLPTTVNMCVALTQSAGGNVAAALANAVIGNLLGVVATPVLLYALLRARVPMPPAAAVCAKLARKVAAPVLLGSLLRRAPPVATFVATRKGLLKRASEVSLLAIVWCAFSAAFADGFGVSNGDLLKLAVGLPAAHVGALLAGLAAFGRCFPRRDAVAAAYCASHKTLAFGLPLLKTLFAANPDLAYFCAPIMILHPLQLLCGSLLVPRLQRYTAGA